MYEKNGMKWAKPDVGISTFHCFIPKLCSLNNKEFSLTSSCLWFVALQWVSSLRIRSINYLIRSWINFETFSTMTLRLILYSGWLNLNFRFSFCALSMTRRVSANFYCTSDSKWWWFYCVWCTWRVPPLAFLWHYSSLLCKNFIISFVALMMKIYAMSASLI